MTKAFNNKNRRMLFTISILFFLAVSCVFADYQIASIISCSIFVIYILLISFCFPNVVLKYLYFVFGIVTNIVGVAIAEFSNLYLAEIDSVSHYVGSLPLIILSRILFLVLVLEYELRKKNEINNTKIEINNKYLKVVTIMVTILYFIEFIHVFGHNALLMQVDRFEYSYLGGVWSKLASYSQYLIVIPIAYFTYTKRKLLSIASVSIYLLFFIWVGNKFGVFFFTLCIFLLVYFSKHKAKERKLRRYIFGTFVGLFAIVLVAVTIQLNYDENNNRTTEYAFSRLAQQGQLWWKTYDKLGGKSFPGEFVNEINATFNPPNSMEENIGAKNGIYNIMYFCAPSNRVNSILRHGARYTEAGYASAYYYFGALGCVVFSILMAFLATRITNLIVRFTKQNNILGIFIVTRLYLFTTGALTMFVFNDFISKGTIVFYFVLLYYLAGFKVKVENKKLVLKTGRRRANKRISM